MNNVVTVITKAIKEISKKYAKAERIKQNKISENTKNEIEVN